MLRSLFRALQSAGILLVGGSRGVLAPRGGFGAGLLLGRGFVLRGAAGLLLSGYLRGIGGLLRRVFLVLAAAGAGLLRRVAPLVLDAPGRRVLGRILLRPVLRVRAPGAAEEASDGGARSCLAGRFPLRAHQGRDGLAGDRLGKGDDDQRDRGGHEARQRAREEYPTPRRGREPFEEAGDGA